jgi:adenylate cyclase
VDFTGDNFLAEFPAALDVVRAAIEIQRVIGARNADLAPDRRMEFRVGLHLGDVTVEGHRIYGDGVNIAARLEGLAEPGGICISSNVHDQVRRKLDLDYQDLGDQRIKNIPEPVRVYRVRLAGGDRNSRAPAAAASAAEELSVPGFSGQPAIAVLAFDNMSGDREQEYFADGIAEDLITRISASRSFPVIARNSSFAYKGKSVDVKQISRELGVRYVVEGSVRKAGDRVRISAQLIDSMGPELWRFEQERAVRQDPQDLGAWDCAQRGMWHLNRLTPKDNAKARSHFEKSVELDPRFVLAHYGLAVTHYFDLAFSWSDSPDRSVAELTRTVGEWAGLDEKDPLGQMALGMAYRVNGQRDKAIAAFELAIRSNPSSALAHFYLGSTLAMAGRSDEAIATLEQGMRLSPRDPMLWAFLIGMAHAHFAAGRYRDAADWSRRSLQARPGWPPSARVLATSLAHLGRVDEARAAFEEALRVQPEFDASISGLFASADPDFVERFRDGLRKAGWKG